MAKSILLKDKENHQLLPITNAKLVQSSLKSGSSYISVDAALQALNSAAISTLSKVDIVTETTNRINSYINAVSVADGNLTITYGNGNTTSVEIGSLEWENYTAE